jgi:nicotinamide-nucleotide adenylyltransferase
MIGLGKVGTVGRFKPLHLGAYAMLKALCENSDIVIIGIGSSNKYNLRNPFTAEETEAMIHAALKPEHNNYSIVHIPDFAHVPRYRNGERWREYVVEKFGQLDYFVAGNAYVMELLKRDYQVIHPAELVPLEDHIHLRGTGVRTEMARGDGWKELVPSRVVDYLEENKLVERFRREFGLETLAMLTSGLTVDGDENVTAEMLHTRED